MNRYIKIALITIVAGLVIYGGFTANYQYNMSQIEKENDLILHEMAQYEANQIKMAELKEARAAEDKRIANLNPFERVGEGRDIKVLYVMNDEYLQDGQLQPLKSWQEEVAEVLLDKYGSTITTNVLSTSWSNITWVWSQYRASLRDEQYDIIVIDVGEQDQLVVDDELYGVFYEALIREMVESSRAVIVPMIGNTIDRQAYARRMIDVNKYYGLKTINMRNVFRVLDSEEDGLTYGGTQPTIDGYSLYAETVVQWFEDQMATYDNQQVLPEDELYSESKRLRNIEYNIQPSSYEGFARQNSRAIGSVPGGFIEYETNGKYNLLTYLKNGNGAIMDIYINGQLYKTIDTYSAHYAADTEIMINEEHEELVIKVVYSSDSLEGGVVQLHSLSSN